MIGTAAEGQTFPATGVPFAMTQWTPQTRAGEEKCVAPYYAADTRIQGFRGSHFLSGSCAQDYGSFTLMPLASPEKLGADEQSSPFSRASERARPYLYSVDLTESGIHAEITGSLRSGMMRFRFAPGEKTGWLSVENNMRLGNGMIRIDPVRQEITGANPVYRLYAGDGQPAGFSGYLVIQFDRPFKVGGTWAGPLRKDGALEQSSSTTRPGAFVSFDLAADETVKVRIGTSFTSIDEARRNLAAEMPDWDFDAAAERARAAWNTALDSDCRRLARSPHLLHRALPLHAAAPRLQRPQRNLSAFCRLRGDRNCKGLHLLLRLFSLGYLSRRSPAADNPRS